MNDEYERVEGENQNQDLQDQNDNFERIEESINTDIQQSAQEFRQEP